MTETSSPAVFISYSAPDRERAENLERSLREHGARTSLDVLDETRRGERSAIGDDDVLPEPVLQELDQAEYVVVLWTQAAAEDVWVTLERDMALDIGSEVLYLAAGGPDPPDGDALADDVDAVVARVGCTAADSGPSRPSGIQLQPGRWRLDGDGVARHIELDLALDGDGGLSGTYSEHGVEKDVTGEWRHDEGNEIVQLTLRSSFGSTSQEDVFRIHLLSKEEGVVTGRDALTIGLGALTYTIRRGEA